jgi:hypothetical protein
MIKLKIGKGSRPFDQRQRNSTGVHALPTTKHILSK